jgi:predicted nucleic acid-binding protein
MHLFIDTNILLSFYHLSSEDLGQLAKLIQHVKDKTLTLQLPEQVETEFYRNRDVKIADALKRLKEQKLNLQFPQICRGFPEYEELRAILEAYGKKHTELVGKVTDGVSKVSLQADSVIQELFAVATKIPTDDEIYEKANRRYSIGNPPGKNDSKGDAINWESLLKNTPQGTDIFFISGDSDYCSPLDEEQFSAYLLNEWKTKKQSNLVFYKKLSSFFKEKSPDIKIATDLEKGKIISDLVGSSNFACSHLAIAHLSN